MYPYALKSRNRERTLLWYSGKRGDFFMLDSSCKLLVAQSPRELKKLLGKRSGDVRWKEGAKLDFDKFWRALRSLRVNRASSQSTCRLLLNGWNFVEDLLRTFDLSRKGRCLRTRVLNRCYDKIFFGSNLPSVTPESKRYEPLWRREEITKLQEAFGSVRQHLEKSGLMH
jgi:hypothetical protein